eukprot:3874212-Amphidinium_carterae.1
MSCAVVRITSAPCMIASRRWSGAAVQTLLLCHVTGTCCGRETSGCVRSCTRWRLMIGRSRHMSELNSCIGVISGSHQSLQKHIAAGGHGIVKLCHHLLSDANLGEEYGRKSVSEVKVNRPYPELNDDYFELRYDDHSLGESVVDSILSAGSSFPTMSIKNMRGVVFEEHASEGFWWELAAHENNNLEQPIGGWNSGTWRPQARPRLVGSV